MRQWDTTGIVHVTKNGDYQNYYKMKNTEGIKFNLYNIHSNCTFHSHATSIEHSRKSSIKILDHKSHTKLIVDRNNLSNTIVRAIPDKGDIESTQKTIIVLKEILKKLERKEIQIKKRNIPMLKYYTRPLRVKQNTANIITFPFGGFPLRDRLVKSKINLMSNRRNETIQELEVKSYSKIKNASHNRCKTSNTSRQKRKESLREDAISFDAFKILEEYSNEAKIKKGRVNGRLDIFVPTRPKTCSKLK